MKSIQEVENGQSKTACRYPISARFELKDGERWRGRPMNGGMYSGRNDKSGDHEVTDVIKNGL